MRKITAQELYDELSHLQLNISGGKITFTLAGVAVDIVTTDTVGITLQSWLRQYMEINDIFFAEPPNTQEFPDFFLDDINPHQNMLEVKAFNYHRTPAFDIANFDSYCSSVMKKPYRLDADYLIFGYFMDKSGYITIEKIWLHKIWEIAGDSERFPLKTQVKRDMIYNIRPNTAFKNDRRGPFNCKEDFLRALYLTLKEYTDPENADAWLEIMSESFYNYYGYELNI